MSRKDLFLIPPLFSGPMVKSSRRFNERLESKNWQKISTKESILLSVTIGFIRDSAESRDYKRLGRLAISGLKSSRKRVHRRWNAGTGIGLGFYDPPLLSPSVTIRGGSESRIKTTFCTTTFQFLVLLYFLFFTFSSVDSQNEGIGTFPCIPGANLLGRRN